MTANWLATVIKYQKCSKYEEKKRPQLNSITLEVSSMQSITAAISFPLASCYNECWTWGTPAGMGVGHHAMGRRGARVFEGGERGNMLLLLKSEECSGGDIAPGNDGGGPWRLMAMGGPSVGV